MNFVQYLETKNFWTMKKLTFFILMLCCCIFTNAETFTITSSIWANEIGEGSGTSIPSIPTCVHRVHIASYVDSVLGLPTALSSASAYFSQAMEDEHIDFVDLYAELYMGSNEMFVNNEICRVSVNYSDHITNTSGFPSFSFINSALPLVYPIAMVNQAAGSSNNVALKIYLNPNYSYYCGSDNAPEGTIDMVTVLMRALAMGCGIQSSLNPETMQMGIVRGGITCVTPFDSQIYNDAGYSFSDVISGNISIANFLINHSIYIDGYDWFYGSGYKKIQLYNEWETGNVTQLSSNTFNTIDSGTYTDDEYNNDFYDLLDYNLIDNVTIREITHYTMYILRKLGWFKSIATGYDDPFEDLHSCTLQCSSQTLLANQSYSVSLSSWMVDLSDVECKLFSVDSAYVIGNVQANSVFSYTSIPQNIQWMRNPETKHIIGEIQGEASMSVSGENDSQQKKCYVEIPYKPNRPIVQRTESEDNGTLHLHLKSFANGSNTYTVSYTGVTNNDTHSFTVAADALDTVIANIPATQLYNATIYGTNNEGNSDQYNFTFGFSAHPTLTLRLVATRTYLIYDLSDNGLIDISDVVISSVKITDIAGNTMLVSSAGSGDVISISSLPRGRYILTVVADGNTYSRMFIK